MNVQSHRVLIVEHDPDLAQLLQQVLSDEGYHTQWVLDSSDVIDRIRQSRPDALIVNLEPHNGEAFALLDALRADPDASRVPILAMTTADSLAESSLTSYNVRGALVKPLDLDNLLEKVGETLGQPTLKSAVPVAQEPAGVVQRAERILAEHSREALFRWVQRLYWEVPWRARSDLSLANVLDRMPVLVEALDAALHFGSVDEYFRRHPEAVDAVREHARTRRGQGIGLSSLIREYSILRDELWILLGRYLPKMLSMGDVLVIERAINGTLDRIIELSMPAYIEET